MNESRMLTNPVLSAVSVSAVTFPVSGLCPQGLQGGSPYSFPEGKRWEGEQVSRECLPDFLTKWQLHYLKPADEIAGPRLVLNLH